MRTLNKNRYVMAAMISLFIFAFGLLLGLSVDEQKMQYIEKINREQKADFDSLQFQYLYLDIIGEKNKSCVVLEKTLENNLNTLQPVLEKIVEYEGNKQFNSDYEVLKREYLIANLRYWILAEKSKNLCGSDLVSLFYFYSQNCKVCNDQGYILSNIKNNLGDKLLVFPIDSDFTKEPMVPIMLSQYNVSEYPTIILNETSLTGFNSKSELLESICPLYKNNYSICKGVSW